MPLLVPVSNLCAVRESVVREFFLHAEFFFARLHADLLGMASSEPAGSSQAVAASSRSATGFRNVYVCRGATKRPFQATVFGEFVGSYSTAEAAAAAAARRHADVAEAKAAKVPATLAAAAIGAKWWSTGSARRSDVLSMTADAALAAARAEGLVLPDSSGGSGYIGVQRRQSKCGTRFEALWRTPDILRRRFGLSHTISFGTWANAQQAAYVLARESKRIGEAPQPSVSAVNDTSAVRQGAKAARDRVNAEMAASAAQFTPVVVYPAAAAKGAIPGPGPVASADGIAASALLEFSAPR